MKFTLSHRAKRAFTLIEILVVIAIISILAAVSIIGYGSISQAQDRSKAKSDMASIALALETFRGKYGDYPRLNAKGGVENCARTLYKCLAGQTYMKVEKGQVDFVDIKNTSEYEPLLDISIMRVGDPSDPSAEVRNLFNDKNAFLDPWGKSYMYYYNSSRVVGQTGAWEGIGFILMSNGEDGENAEIQSMFSTGIKPSEDDFRAHPRNLDNIVHDWD